jgi:hypothetical protein
MQFEERSWPASLVPEVRVEVESQSDSDSSLDMPSAMKPEEDEARDTIFKNLNNALQEIAEAYLAHDSPAADMCAASDCEDTASTFASPQDLPSESSDSEDALPRSMSVSSQSDQEDSSSKRCRDSFTSSPTSWMSQRSRKFDIGRATRSFLNKLTEERFETLCGQILALPIATSEQLAVVVAEIFKKATSEQGFRSLYTELCMRLDTHLTGQTSCAVGGKAFRRALVNECQALFERNLVPEASAVSSDLNEEEMFEAEVKLKTIRLGNMRFIGDLLVRRLLSPRLLPPIVLELLQGSEASVESLIALLTVVAPEFEMKPTLYQAPLREAFAVLRNKLTDKLVSKRIRFLITDLLDEKARGWTSRSIDA